MHALFTHSDIDLLKQKLESLIASKQPFCMAQLPTAMQPDGIFLVPSDAASVKIRVKPWLSSRWIDFSSNSLQDARTMEVCRRSTSKDVYCQSLEQLIDRLKHRGGKTVICRQICGKFKNFAPADMALRYFAETRSDNSVGFFFFHPFTGFWMGSTPELILERGRDGSLRTMALAGTRRRDTGTPWDNKNIEEHNLVADDIEARLRLTGIGFTRKDTHTLPYGTIEHLCTELCSQPVPEAGNGYIFDRIVEEIQPTPALAGYPRVQSLAEIEEFEKYPRHMYAGCINIAADDFNITFGILRCVHFDHTHWAICTGSGITADSVPACEWAETESKAQPLIHTLSNE